MEIDIKEFELLCDKGSGIYNEDMVGLCKKGAWVLDGATGLNNKNLISKESDAKWYVSWWNKYLQENIDKDKSLKEIVLEGLEKIKKEYLLKLNGLKIENLDLPSASVVIIKFYTDKLEYILLGDCTLLLNKLNEDIIIKDERVCKLDEKVFSKMENLNKRCNLTIFEKKNILLPLIIENRLKKNSDKGYWILEFNKEAVEKSIHGYIDVEGEVRIMMSSDGFSCAWDRYNIFKENEMIEVGKNKGIEYINNKIRKLEKEDYNGIIFPRFKESDDSSCVYLHITKK
ncbi:hypothetical protein [Terrisporobacter glycolicus]|uniref:PPM-type phosphatase domain-containing protein n=1 Tax=Terrisporobacter glycolicus ATCC 14880 = DSM 1288 TaxID=1121315 RepID=A0ABZ2EW57_9FIRM|nr:hypothetical protein [Terrisporobacter glycolicus]